MIRAVALLLGLLLGSAGFAQSPELPAFFDVTSVASDDRLNIRAEPSARSEILGTFAPNARDIEVIRTSPDGRWAQVNHFETAAWVAARFLDAQSGQLEMPSRLECFGTEPFWSLRIEGPVGSYSDFEVEEELLSLDRVSPVQHMDRFAALMAGASRAGVSTVRRATCSDGMSDRNYGLEIDVIWTDTPFGAGYVSGCCSLLP